MSVDAMSRCGLDRRRRMGILVVTCAGSFMSVLPDTRGWAPAHGSSGGLCLCRA